MWTNYEGKRVLLYEDPRNPYETITITAKLENGCLQLSDYESEHGPDGGSSDYRYDFDEENTRKLFDALSKGVLDPFIVMKAMIGYENRLRMVLELCKKNGIEYTASVWW